MSYNYEKYKFETIQLHAGQENPDPASDARAVPIYQTTSYVFKNSAHAAAITYTFLNLANAGDNIVSVKTIYGGTYNLLSHTLPQYGITTTFVDADEDGAFEDAINDKTKALFFEIIGNPNATLIDIEKVAKIAHAHKIPLVVDSTFATPYLIRPFEHGADIVVLQQSLSVATEQQ